MPRVGVLAQVSGGGGLGGLLGGPAPAPLPAAPLWERWLFEDPLWPGVALVVGALAALWLMNRAGSLRRGVVVASVLAAGGVGVFVIAGLVTTERERLRGATADLVGAVARTDARAVGGGLLAADVRLRATELGREMDRDQILAFVEGEMTGMNKVENYRVMETQATVDGPNVARTHTNVRVTPARTGGVVFSWWRLDWRREADGRWLVTDIAPLSVQDR